MAQKTSNDIPRDPVDTDSVYLVALQKADDHWCGRRAIPVGAAKTAFLKIGSKALGDARKIDKVFDPDADDEFNANCIVDSSDIWDSKILDVVDKYQKLTNLDLTEPMKFNVYAIVFAENSVTLGNHYYPTKQIAIFREIDITRPIRGNKFFMTLNGNDIKKLDDPLLEIADSCDIVYTGNKLYVLKIHPFYRLFRSLKGNDKKVNALVKDFKDNATSLSFTKDSLEIIRNRAQNSVRFANRLDSVVRKYKKKSPTEEQIKAGIEIVDAQNLLKFDSNTGEISFKEEQADDVLKFLNEDLFKSVIFKENYAAGSKRKI